MPTPRADSQRLVSHKTPLASLGGGGHVLLDAIKAYVAADRLNTGLDTHGRQNAYDALKRAKQRLYDLADER